MTYYDLYVADVDDPYLKRDGGDWSGNCPGGLEGGLIYCKNDIDAFNRVLEMIGDTIRRTGDVGLERYPKRSFDQY